MTTPPSGPRTPARRGLWVGSLFLVVAGLFGMHGLANHGPCDMPAMTGTSAAEMALPHAAHGSVLTTAPDAAHSITTAMGATTTSVAVSTATAIPATAGVLEEIAQVAAAAGGHGHGRGNGMVVLCVAILAGVLIALGLLARRPGRGLSVPVDRRRVNVHGLGRDRDPPSLTWLSIRRC